MDENLVASRSHLQDNLGSRRSFWTEILSTLILLLDDRIAQTTIESQFWFRSNQFDQKLPMHNENSHCQKRDEGISSGHCGVAKGSHFSARSLDWTTV